MRLSNSEKRKSNRERRSGSISWRLCGDLNLQPGWLLEESEDGMAFAWRGENVPEPGMLVELVDADEGPTASNTTQAIVRRVVNCHEDLAVIAIERVQYSPFPAVIGPEPKLLLHHAASNIGGAPIWLSEAA